MRLGIIALVLVLTACIPVAAAGTHVLGQNTPTIPPTPTVPAATPMPAVSLTLTAVAPTIVSVQKKPSTPTPPPCRETAGRSITFYFPSPTLGRRIAWSVYLPPCYNDDPARGYPVVYLLPGLYADNTQWLDFNLASTADALIARHAIAPFVAVMPDGGYGADDDDEAFILNDLIPNVEQTLHVSHKRADRAIGGVSRGGYVALDLAIRHPELFSAVGGHSPATDDDLFAALGLAAGARERSTLRIYLDVGRSDPTAADVASFAAAAKAHHLTSVYHLNDGGHDRPYWRAHIAEYLVFYAAGWRN